MIVLFIMFPPLSSFVVIIFILTLLSRDTFRVIWCSALFSCSKVYTTKTGNISVAIEAIYYSSRSVPVYKCKIDVFARTFVNLSPMSP